MKITTFFSLLVGSIVFSGWGFSSYTAGYEGGLPYVGFMLDTEVTDAIAKATAGAEEGTQGVVVIPEMIDLTKIEEQYNRLPCAKTLFPNIPDWNEIEVEEDEPNSIIGITNPNDLQGCLSVWWNKDEETIGNVLWGMSDGNQGTLFLSKVSVTNGVAKKVSENLYLLEKGDEEEEWRILSDMSKWLESEVEDLSLTGIEDEEVLEGFEDDSSDSQGGWKDVESFASGKLDWTFISEYKNPEDTNLRDFSTWIQDVSKWLGSIDLLLKTETYYGTFSGYFVKAKGQEQ